MTESKEGSTETVLNATLKTNLNFHHETLNPPP